MKDGMKQDANEKHIPTCSEEKHPDDQCNPHGHISYGYESQDSAED